MHHLHERLIVANGRSNRVRHCGPHAGEHLLPGQAAAAVSCLCCFRCNAATCLPLLPAAVSADCRGVSFLCWRCLLSDESCQGRDRRVVEGSCCRQVDAELGSDGVAQVDSPKRVQASLSTEQQQVMDLQTVIWTAIVWPSDNTGVEVMPGRLIQAVEWSRVQNRETCSL
jgi:hypothetical protein